MILVIDIGNSHCRFGIFGQEEHAGEGWQLLSRSDCAVADCVAEIQHLDLSGIESAVLVCVNDSVLSGLCGYLESVKISYDIMGKSGYSLGFRSICKDDLLLQNLGADRAANILGGLHFCSGQSFIAIDCGTAITLDYCDESGLFCGGVIMAGQDLMARSLHDYTDKLPLLSSCDMASSVSILGQNTVEAMTSGLHYGLVAMIDGVIMRIIEHSSVSPLLFLCGGNADFYLEFSSYDVILQKDLTLWGGLCYGRAEV